MNFPSGGHLPAGGSLPDMKEITSAGNAAVRQLVRLREKSSERRASGTFIEEGERLVLDTPPAFLREIYITREAYERLEDRLPGSAAVTILSEAAMAKASGTQSPQGVLAVVSRPTWDLSDLVSGQAPLVVMLEDIQDPGNLGTIFRTAEAAGAGGVVLTKGTVDLFNPKTVRATMSSLFRVPFVTAENLPEVIRGFRKQYGIRTHAACPDADALSYTAADYRGPCAFAIGNEGNGLSADTAAAADDTVYIPMAGRIESLNAAVSASILMYEAARQRNFR